MKQKAKHTAEELKRLQSLTLEEKIALSKLRITEWYEHWQGKVSVSYSGGKDSTVLLKLVRELYPEVPAVYVDTRLDFPEVREHVKQTENVICLRPEMNFREVVDKFGYCYPSKDIAKYISAARRNIPYAKLLFDGKTVDGRDHKHYQRIYPRWKWLIDAPVKISDKCCMVMKEKPLDKFQRKHGLKTYVGIMADESDRRKKSWLKVGCHNFSTGMSRPLSFWTEQDVLRYIVDNKLAIPSCYGEIVADKKNVLHTTKEKRTGCIFCPIAAHLRKPNSFQRLKESHPSLYNYCMSELGLDEFLTAVGVPH